MSGSTEEGLSIDDVMRGVVADAERIRLIGDATEETIFSSGLPAGVAVERTSFGDEGEPERRGGSGRGTLTVVAIGSDATRQMQLMAAFAALRRVAVGGRVVLSQAWPIDGVGAEDLVDHLAELGIRVDEIDPVLGSGIAGVIIGTRIEESTRSAPRPSRDSRGDFADLRAANRVALTAYRQDRAPISATDDDASTGSGRELRRLTQRLHETETRLSAVEASTSYRLGRTIVQSVRQPARAVRPFVNRIGLVRRPTSARGGETEPSRRTDSRRTWYSSIRHDPERLYQAYSSGADGSRDRLVIAAVVRDETAAVLEPDALVHRLTPNDAVMGIERVDPDLLLVESGAFGAGRQWAFTGDPAAVDRDRTILRMLDVCRSLGRPTILWRTAATPRSLGVADLARRFDVVVDPTDTTLRDVGWGTGVQLATFNLIGLDTSPSSEPLAIAAWDARAPRSQRVAYERLLSGLISSDDGLDLRLDVRSLGGAEDFPPSIRQSIRGVVDPLRAAGLYRSHALVVDDPFSRRRGDDHALEALACGARLVAMEGPRPASIPDASWVPADGRVAAVTSGEKGTARPLEELRATWRGLYLEHAVPVALKRLVERLGSTIDPLARRGVTLIIAPDPDLPWGAISAAILDQTQRPREVVVATSPGVDVPAGRDEALERAGIAFRSSSGTDIGTAAGLLQAATLARQPWVVTWSTFDHPRDALLDLAAGAETSGADVIGYRDSHRDQPLAFVDDLPLGEALVRRTVLGSESIPSDGASSTSLAHWARHGVRLFAVAARWEGSR